MCLWQKSPPRSGQGPPPPTAGLDQAGASMSLRQPQPLHTHEPGALLCPPTTVAAVPAAQTTWGCVGWSAMGYLHWPTSAQMFLAMGVAKDVEDSTTAVQVQLLSKPALPTVKPRAPWPHGDSFFC